MKKLMLAGVLLVSACTTAPMRSGPPPVVEGSAPGIYVEPDVPETSPRTEAPQRNTAANGAVVALLDRADAYRRSGDSGNEAAAIERALRIDPRNARLWSRLAVVRLDQDQPRQAEQLALKSNALAAGDPRLQAQNWRLIATARRALQDNTGAREAERRAAALR